MQKPAETSPAGFCSASSALQPENSVKKNRPVTGGSQKTTCFVNVKVGLIQKIENHPHSQVLRIEPVRAAEQEHSFLNVESEQQHGQTVNTETETAVRRTAVFKEFKVELNVFTESFFVRLFLRIS